MTSYIHWWGQRVGTKWHLVETEVTDRLVMRCGRLMRLETRAGVLAFVLEPTGERCEQCAGRIVAD